jgi:hypothetical protein
VGKLTKLGSVFFLAILAVLAPGCATTPEDNSGPQGCVIIDNREGGGAQARIFLISSTSGWRLGIGEVAMGTTKEFCTGRVTIPERVYILIERPATMGATMNRNQGRGIRSRDFVLRTDDIWSWDINRNLLSRAIVM